MATNSLKNTSGTQAWDVTSNWSLGQIPQTGDDVSIVAGASDYLTLTIAASDPAYTIGSLTESTTNSSPAGESLSIAGRLTVTGTTSVSRGMISVIGNASVTLNNVTLTNSAQIDQFGSAASTLSIGSLTAGSDTNGGGSVLVQAGSAMIGTISGSITVVVSSATATVGTSSGSGSFLLSNGMLVLQSSVNTLGDIVAPSNNISYIDLSNIAYQTGETYSTTLVSFSTFNIYSITLQSALGQTLYTFQRVTGVGPFNATRAPTVSVASDGAGGTLVTLACYTAGTRIAVPGGEKIVSDLAIGDRVMTASGHARPIKWIGRRSYGGRFLQANARALPVRFHAGSLGEGVPRRDLLVSPEHAMFLDGLLIPARCLVNGANVAIETGLDRVDYFHVELDSHDVILAEGAPSETFVDDNSRMMFLNALEFAALYPDVGRPPALYCAPRVEDGNQLATIRDVIDRRAGLDRPGIGEALRGHVDQWDGLTLTGWAQNPDQPEAPVCLDVFIDGAAVARTLANQFRPDLLTAGLGSGCHSFTVRLPKAARRGRIHVCRVSDGAVVGSLDRQERVAA